MTSGAKRADIPDYMSYFCIRIVYQVHCHLIKESGEESFAFKLKEFSKKKRF